MFDGLAGHSLARSGRSLTDNSAVIAAMEGRRGTEDRAAASVERVTDMSSAATVHLSKDGSRAMARGRGPPRTKDAKDAEKLRSPAGEISKQREAASVEGKPAGVTRALQSYRQASTSRVASPGQKYRHRDLPVPLPSPLPPPDA